MRRRGSFNAIAVFLVGFIVFAFMFPLFLDVADRIVSSIVPLINNSALQGDVVKMQGVMPYLPLLGVVVVFVWALAKAHEEEERVWPVEG